MERRAPESASEKVSEGVSGWAHICVCRCRFVASRLTSEASGTSLSLSSASKTARDFATGTHGRVQTEGPTSRRQGRPDERRAVLLEYRGSFSFDWVLGEFLVGVPSWAMELGPYERPHRSENCLGGQPGWARPSGHQAPRRP